MRNVSLANALVLLLTALFCAAEANATPEDLDFFTDFEDIGPNTNPGEIIVVGVPPETAELSGGAFAGSIRTRQLNFSGSRAWMVQTNGTGVIDFTPEAARVEFWPFCGGTARTVADCAR